MIEVKLSKIIIDEEKKEQVIVLKEKNGDKLLPIVIGLNEAAAIKMELSGFVPPRPLTHDLIKDIMDNLRVNLEKVVIDKLIDTTFHAKLCIKDKDGKQSIIDARPSDSIALAIRMKVPIFVGEEVFKNLFPNVL